MGKLEERLNAALGATPPAAFTRRDTRLPAVPGKAHAVIGMRRAEAGYVKTADGLEVDFLARHRLAGEELTQVCADLSRSDTLARELRPLAAAAREHPRAKRMLLVLDRDALTQVEAPGVEVQAAYDWLLAAPDDV